MSFLKKYLNSDIIKASLMGVGVFIFFVAFEFIFPSFFVYDDNAIYFSICYTYNYRCLFEHGQIPLVNFHQFMGYPWFSQSQTSVFYLPIYPACFIAQFFPNRLGFEITLLIAFHLALAAAFSYLLFRYFKVESNVSLLLSFTWITLPFVCTIPRTWVMFTYITAFLPINFLILFELMKESNIKKWVILSLIRAFFIYSGYVQNFFNLFIMELFFISIATITKNLINSKKKFIICFFASYLLTAFICAPLILSASNNILSSHERGKGLSYEDVVTYPLELLGFLKAQIVEFGSWPSTLGFESQGIMLIFYIGIPLLIIPFFLFNKNIRDVIIQKKYIIFLFMSIIAFLYSTKLYGIFYHIPIFGMFRWPFKSFLFFTFFLMLTIGLIYNFLNEKYKKIYITLLMISILSNIFLLINSGPTLRTYFMKGSLPQICKQEIKDTNYRIITAYIVGRVSKLEVSKYASFINATNENLYHFSGYDPTVSRMNKLLTLNLSAIASLPYPIDQKILDYISFCGVKYLIAPDFQDVRDSFSNFKQLELKCAQDEVCVYENTNALPVVRFEDNPSEKVRFDYGINQIDIKTLRGGKLQIAVAPLPFFNVYVNGVKQEVKNNFPLVVSTPDKGAKISLKYEDPYFNTGACISIITLFITAFFILRDNISKK